MSTTLECSFEVTMAMMVGCFPANFCHQDISCWVLEAEVNQDMEEPVESMAEMIRSEEIFENNIANLLIYGVLADNVYCGDMYHNRQGILSILEG